MSKPLTILIYFTRTMLHVLHISVFFSGGGLLLKNLVILQEALNVDLRFMLSIVVSPVIYRATATQSELFALVVFIASSFFTG